MNLSFDALIAERHALAALPPGPARDRAGQALDRRTCAALIEDLARRGDLTPGVAEKLRDRAASARNPAAPGVADTPRPRLTEIDAPILANARPNRVHRQQAELAAAVRGFTARRDDDDDDRNP